MKYVLIIDEDSKHREALAHLVKKVTSDVEIVDHSVSADGTIEGINDWHRYALIIMDSRAGGAGTLNWMGSIVHHYDDHPEFIIMSSDDDPASPSATRAIVRAMKLGAHNFFFKRKLEYKPLMESVREILGKPGQNSAGGAEQQESMTADASYDEADYEMNIMADHDHYWPFTMNDILKGTASIGKYQIKAHLGSDNTASIFLAHMAGLKKPMILKLVSHLKMAGKVVPEEFSSGFDTLSHLHHENLVHLFNYEVIGNHFLLVTEYLPGGTLKQRMANERLEENYAMTVFRQILQGLSALHDMNLEVHELMPREILFRDEHTPVITHLGLINRLHALANLTEDWATRYASAVYTTPETIQRQATGQHSDVYLAGLIGFEMMAGEPMYSHGSEQDILYAHAAEPPRQLPNPQHPMNTLLQRMLNKIPEKRLPDAGAALLLFDELLPDFKYQKVS